MSASPALDSDLSLVDGADVRDGGHRVFLAAEGRGRDEVAGPLQPSPGIAPVARVVGDRRHRQRVQRLQEQRRHAAHEHRAVIVHLPDGTVRGEPAVGAGADAGKTLLQRRPRGTVADDA